MTIERSLSVAADMTIDIGKNFENRIHVSADGNTIVVEVPSVASGFMMMRELGSFAAIGSRLERLSGWLTAVGLTVVVRTSRRRLLTVGQEGGNSWLMRLVGVSNAKLHLK